MKATQRLVERVDGWIRVALGSRTPTNRVVDIHIDQLDSAMRERSQWITGGMAVLRSAQRVRDRTYPDDSVALVYYLSQREALQGRCPANIRYLRREFTQTPPELVWLQGRLRHRYATELVKGLELVNWGVALRGARIVYFEHRRGSGVSGELSRNLWVVLPGKSGDPFARLFR